MKAPPQRLERFAKLEVTRAPVGSVRLTPEESFLARADHAYRRGESQVALKLFARTLADDRATVAAWRGQLLALLDLAENDEAALWADRALLACPDATDLWAAKAMALARCGDPDDARRASDRSLRAADVGWLSWVGRGDVFAGEDAATAERSFDRAIALSQRDWLVLTEIARSWRIARQCGRAFETAVAATRLAPREPRAWRELGEAALAVSDRARARAAFAEAVALAPADPIANAGLTAARERSLWCSLRLFFVGGRTS